VTPTYRKAGPIRRGHLRRASLWLGDDHALLVTGTRFFEKYRRFYYTDIQAITIRRARRFIFPVYSTLAALVFGFLLLAAWPRRVTSLEWIGVAGLAAVAIERYVAAMFRSCYTHLFTSVSSEELPSLHKFRSAAKAVALLEQKIQQAQGPMPDGWQTASEFQAVRILPRASSGLPAQTGAAPQIGQARWAGFAFIGLILYAACDYFYLLQPQTRWMGVAIKIVLLIEVGLCVYGYIQLYRQQKSGFTGYLLLGAVFFAGIISYAESLVLSLPLVRNPNAALIKIPMNHPGMPYLAGISIGGSVVLGVVGLLGWLRSQPSGISRSENLSIVGRT